MIDFEKLKPHLTIPALFIFNVRVSLLWIHIALKDFSLF